MPLAVAKTGRSNWNKKPVYLRSGGVKPATTPARRCREFSRKTALRIFWKKVGMTSKERETRLDDVLTEYAVEHLDWPRTPEELDQYPTGVEESYPDARPHSRCTKSLSMRERAL